MSYSELACSTSKAISFDADQDSTLHDPHGVFRAQLRVLNSLSHWDTCSVNHFGRGLQMATNGVFTAASPRT